MLADTSPDPDENPYHPYQETDRYRAFRNGWAAHHRQEPLTSNPFPLAQIGCALAWLDGWTAAADGEARTMGRRQRRAAHRVDSRDFVWDE
jgi:hypothetical protein